MKYLFLNLKRFDIPFEMGGVNRFARIDDWGRSIIEATEPALEKFKDVQFVQFYPEAHILNVNKARHIKSPIEIGCQGVHQKDLESNVNFGAFTTERPATAARSLGCSWVLIGHYEERKKLSDILAAAKNFDKTIVDRILNQSIHCAINAGLKVLFCIGETFEEQTNYKSVLMRQIDVGLAGIESKSIVIAYEPVWSIGPGKLPPDRNAIVSVAKFIKSVTKYPLVYGGGLKIENAAMLASIPLVDGGLIALTRFTGEVGFYPAEYINIIRTYLEGIQQ